MFGDLRNVGTNDAVVFDIGSELKRTGISRIPMDWVLLRKTLSFGKGRIWRES